MKQLLLILLLLPVVLQAQEMSRSTPEEEGVSSEGILQFLNAAEKEKGMHLHSFMLLRHGKIIADGHWYPYDCTNKHTLYSVTKAFTATAIGLAVNEGAFSLDDKVISFFPEHLPDTISPNLAGMTIRHLLMMSPGYNSDPDILRTGDWIKAALAAPVAQKPGSNLFYHNTGPFLLSAIIQKVTGQKLEDYLTPRLFTPLGITDFDWEMNPQRINVGGWGLRLSVESMAKLGQLYLQKGKWNGKQILPESWVEEATAIQNKHLPQWLKNANVDTSANDYAKGYGYFFWHGRHNTYRASGALGQFIIMMPDQDVVLAITAGNPSTQAELNLVWEHLLPAFKTSPLPDNPKALDSLNAKLSALQLPAPEKRTQTKMGKAISGKAFVMEPNKKGIEEMVFLLNGDHCKTLVKTAAERHEMNFGNGYWRFGDTARPGPYMEPGITLNWPALYKVAGSFRWKAADTLELFLHYIEGTHPQTYICKFERDEVTVEIKDPVEPKESVVLKGKMRE